MNNRKSMADYELVEMIAPSKEQAQELAVNCLIKLSGMDSATFLQMAKSNSFIRDLGDHLEVFLDGSKRIMIEIKE